MINRKVIRRKVLQNLFKQTYLEEDDQGDSAVLKSRLKDDLEAVYGLHLYLLNTIEEVAWYAKRNYEEKQAAVPISDRFQYTLRFYDNFIVQKLFNSKNYQKIKESYKVFWMDDDSLLRRIFLDFKASDLYQEYIHSRQQAGFEDEEILLYFLKHYPKYFNLFRQHLEEVFPNFGDDQRLAVNMASKSIRNIAGDPEIEDFLVPIATDWEDKLDYAYLLFEKSKDIKEEYQNYVEPKITQWEPSQLATVDVLILKMALAEFIYFPTIPSQVTINEYLELGKDFSNPGSKKFLNAVLDRTYNDLEKHGMVNKTGPGLVKNSPGHKSSSH